MKKTLTLFVLLCTLCMSTHATLLFNESFDYTTGNLYSTGSANGWWQNTGTETEPIQVIDGSLTYAGYESTAMGKSIKLKDIQNAQKVYKKFDSDQMVATGSIYYAALINITSADEITSSNTSYFMAMCAQTASGLKDKGSGTDVARLSAYAASEGKYKLAISRANTTLASTTAEYDFGTTYLVVVKYTIVEGVTNDIVSLYVNPTTTEPTNADALYDNTSGSDVSTTKGGFAALVVRQGATASRKAPILTIDAIKVATAWADLFESGDTPDPTPTATITAPSTLTFTAPIFVGETYTSKFTISGSNLTGDITLASNNTEVVLDKTTIAQADAASGVEVTATLTAATAGSQTATITLSSTGATDVTVTASWQAIEVTKVDNIAALKAAIAADGENYTSFQCTGEAVVTYTEKIGISTSTPVFYIEDATGAVRIDDESGASMISLNIGDKIKDFIAYLGNEAGLSGQPLTWGAAPTVVSSGNDWTPQVVTLKDLQENAADYLLELVKVENVTLDNTDANYKLGNNNISQDGTNAVINLTSDNTLVGTAKPAKADIVGISYYTSGYNIRVRTADDIVAKTTPTAIETIALDQLTGEYEIYTVSGQRTDALQQGVNIIRQGDKTYKVIR